MKIGHPKNFWGGVLFIAIGTLFALIAKGLKFGDTVLLAGYSMGTPARMGPGFFPFYLGMMLILLGIIIAASGFKVHDRDAGRVDPFHWKPIFYVLGSVILFGVLLKTIGMLLAGLMLVVGASMASQEFQWKRVLLLATGLLVFCSLVFVGGLKLPIPLCPDVEALQSSIGFCRG